MINPVKAAPAGGDEQFIVTRLPKAKYRGSYRTLVAVVKAKSAAAAVRAARQTDGFDGDHGSYSAPKAEQLQLGKTYLI